MSRYRKKGFMDFILVKLLILAMLITSIFFLKDYAMQSLHEAGILSETGNIQRAELSQIFNNLSGNTSKNKVAVFSDKNAKKELINGSYVQTAGSAGTIREEKEESASSKQDKKKKKHIRHYSSGNQNIAADIQENFEVLQNNVSKQTESLKENFDKLVQSGSDKLSKSKAEYEEGLKNIKKASDELKGVNEDMNK